MRDEFGHETPAWKVEAEALLKRVEQSQREVAKEIAEREREARARGITVDELIAERWKEYQRQLAAEEQERASRDPWS